MKNGVTLIELLVAMAVSAVVVVLSSRIFLSGHREFLGRVEESGRITELYRAKNTLQQALRGEVIRCENGSLWLQEEGKEKEMGPWLKSRFPDADSLEFHCFEVGEADSLVKWESFGEPPLVEYRLTLGKGSKRDLLQGSWLK